MLETVRRWCGGGVSPRRAAPARGCGGPGRRVRLEHRWRWSPTPSGLRVEGVGSRGRSLVRALEILGTSRSVRAYAYPRPSISQGYDGLFGLVKQGLGRDPLSAISSCSHARRRSQVLGGMDGTLLFRRLERSQFASLWRDEATS